MSRHYLYQKDQLVLEIDNQYNCIIHDYDHLPIGLRYPDVNYDDVMHGWLESRNMSLGRTNAKLLLQACGISQRNSYTIAKLYHFASITDCYWMKDEGDPATWDDVNLYCNTPEIVLAKTALFGEKNIISAPSKVHTPEYATQGMTAKAWIKEKQGLFLYKIAKKELAACEILNALNIAHVPYVSASVEELQLYTNKERLDNITKAGEVVVKCPCLTNEDTSIITWEDFCIYCDRHDKNPYNLLPQIDHYRYDEMLVADYILGNNDRHEGNWGFLVDNNIGTIIRLHPLMDHDHAFEEGTLMSQTTDNPCTMQEAAMEAIQYIGDAIHFGNVLAMDKPDTLTDMQWNGVLERTKNCVRQQQIYQTRVVEDKELD